MTGLIDLVKIAVYQHRLRIFLEDFGLLLELSRIPKIIRVQDRKILSPRLPSSPVFGHGIPPTRAANDAHCLSMRRRCVSNNGERVISRSIIHTNNLKITEDLGKDTF